MAVEPPSSNEASMLGELKLLIDQLDQQTKATMKDSLYRISRHAQVSSYAPMPWHTTCPNRRALHHRHVTQRAGQTQVRSRTLRRCTHPVEVAHGCVPGVAC